MKFLNILALATLCAFSSSHSINFKALAASALTFKIVSTAASSIFSSLSSCDPTNNVFGAVDYLGRRFPSYEKQFYNFFNKHYIPTYLGYMRNHSKIKGLVGMTVGALAAIKVYNYLSSEPKNK